MPEAQMTVEQWTDLFRAIGLSDDDMNKWHAEFERRHPESHQSFLEWLNLPSGKIEEVRAKSAAS